MEIDEQNGAEQVGRDASAGDAFAHLSAMESDLWRLSGLMLAGRILGEAEDHIDPAAVAALAGCSFEIIERLQGNWKLAFEAADADQRVRADAR